MYKCAVYKIGLMANKWFRGISSSKRKNYLFLREVVGYSITTLL